MIHEQLVTYTPFKVRKKFLFLWTLFLILMIPSKSSAQTLTQYRLYYFQTNTINERWKLESAGGIHWRPTDDWFRIEFRTLGYYQVDRDVKLLIGQRSHFLFNDGNFSNFEFRPYQGVAVTWPRLDLIKFTNRAMLEERFYWYNDDTKDNLIQARFRYRLDTKIPINNPALVDNTYYFRPMIETFFNFGEDIDHLFFSQIRYVGAAGYRFSKKTNIEFRYEYLNEWSSPSADTKYTNMFRLVYARTISKK